MTGQFEQVEHVERWLRHMYADAASARTEIGGATAADVIGRGRARRRRTRMTVAGVAAAVAVLAAASISVAPSLVNHASQPATHWKHLRVGGSIPNDMVGVWVDSLPSGPVAQAAWVEGDTLHLGAKTVRITGDGINASSRLVVHARTSTGWFVSLTTSPHGRLGAVLGVVHPDGRFVEFQKYPGVDPLLVSPDGTRALVGADGGGDLIDTATGRIIMPEPPNFGAIAWGNDGIYGGVGRAPVMWRPGTGIVRSPFDASHCHSTGRTTGSLQASYSGCTIPGLVSVSPDGKTALVGKDVVDLGTGRRIQFAPHNPFRPYYTSPGYTVLWQGNEHVLLELWTPTIPADANPSGPETSTFVIVRCNVDTGSCERASDPINTINPGLAPLQ